jgi:hyperosmotically inducible periplasmic protein
LLAADCLYCIHFHKRKADGMKSIFPAVCCLVVAAGCGDTRAPSAATGQADRSTSANQLSGNTGVNVRDRKPDAVTPLNQNENEQDVTMTASIRKQVVAAKMSTDATNVKIITQNGHVTLRGPVDSVDEKSRILKIAEGIAGAKNVDNQLEIAEQR